MRTCPIRKHVQGLSFMEESMPNIMITVFYNNKVKGQFVYLEIVQVQCSAREKS